MAPARWGPLQSARGPTGPVPLAAAYAILLAALADCLNQLFNQTQGPWLEGASAAVLGLSLLGTAQLAARAIRRYREGLPRRALGWGLGSAAMALLAVLALLSLTILARVAMPGGADVRATRPVLHGLARPPGAILVREQPGLAQTESITDEFRTVNLEEIAPFYRGSLAADGWTETEGGGQSDLILVFKRGDFVVTVLVDQAQGGQVRGSGNFSVTVDHLRLTPSPVGGTQPSRAWCFTAHLGAGTKNRPLPSSDPYDDPRLPAA